LFIYANLVSEVKCDFSDKKVFPHFYILGWYSTGSDAEEADMHIHKAVSLFYCSVTYFNHNLWFFFWHMNLYPLFRVCNCLLWWMLLSIVVVFVLHLLLLILLYIRSLEILCLRFEALSGYFDFEAANCCCYSYRI
jgi:hypothetical protein